MEIPKNPPKNITKNNALAWEKEYRNPKLVTLDGKPQASVKEFLRWLRKKEGVSLEGLRTLDLGCGTGRNTLHLTEEGASKALGIDISSTAISYARKAAETLGLVDGTGRVEFQVGSIGEALPCPDQSADLILDVIASNSLSESERTIYLAEMKRVLAPHGHLFVRTLCKDGDTNAKELLKTHAGGEKDTYMLPETGFVERVFSKEDFTALYDAYFDLVYLDKETHYTLINNRRFKRHFWIAYLKAK